MEFKLEEKEQTMETQKPIETQVAEWSATESVLTAAVEATKGVTVAGHVDGPKKGREAVHAAMMTLSAHRVSIEKRRTELKAPILSLGKLVDSEAKRLTAITEGRENELRADRDAYDAEQAKIAAAKKAEEDRIEAEAAKARAEALQARVDKVAALGGVPNLALLSALSGDAFAEQIAGLEAAKAKREAAEQVEIDKVRAELEAERVRLAKEREEAEAAEAARLQKIQREAEEKAEAERIAARKAGQEREAAELARTQKEEAEAEAARIAAEKPDRERLQDWATNVAATIDALPEVASDALREEAEEMRNNILNLLNVFGAEMGGA